MARRAKGMSALKYSVFHDVLFPAEPPEYPEGFMFDGMKLMKLIKYTADVDLPLRKQAIVVFDIETTGLKAGPDRIIEIGAMRLEADTRKTSSFSTLISIPGKVPKEITELTGITDKMLKGKPTFKEMSGDFLEFIKGAVLFAHNVDFDFGFLKTEFSKLGITIQWDCFCTYKMAKKILPDLGSYKLGSLANHFGIEFSSRAHRSMADVGVTVQVLTELMLRKAPKTLKDLKTFKGKE
jgi:DNA polymerase III epsilon subunit family exonuclease